ncbi:MAG: putative DNA binding domain-containing protein [Deltaproteobacteria bacterium]|nr:putative DNA binding domain-containing protein [Deltaproteobacteria bacterium]MBW1949833.1 putative DNA binding domain-containing protein [Deltaproteobacteria bacterium]MBW2007658.1 putative DNA binding domain-containing protein [Deltaproteobacteria bacterium]
MNERVQQLEQWMRAKENEHFEFKEAKNRYDFQKLVKYCVALANEGGGKMILGVTDKVPRKVVGTKAFQNLERTKAGLIERMSLRIDAEEIMHPQGRVVVFHVPSRPIGMAIHYEGRYFMRAGEDLAPMLPDMLKRIFDETGPDYTAEICSKAALNDLDLDAVEDFRNRWIRKSKNENLRRLSSEQLLLDAELLTREGITYAALILFGTKEALGRYLAQAEVIFEYRSSDATGPAQDRQEFRQGFFSFYEELWSLIELRNDKQHFRDGLFVWDIPTFNEEAVREAILNAVSHRDYRMAGSVFVRQYPRRMEIVSPGGFPPGITPENILWEQSPRNRRIAEAFARCGLVERSGQGMNMIYEACIRESKPRPDFTHTDPYHVWLTLHGEVQHPEFLRFLEKLGEERLESFTTQDLLVVDHVFRNEPVPEGFKGNLLRLVERGIIEQISRGRGTRYVLSRRFYKFIGKKGVYTRKRGLDRETNKALILKHIRDNAAGGAPLRDLIQVLPALSRFQVQRLVQELRDEGLVKLVGATKGARWFPVEK